MSAIPPHVFEESPVSAPVTETPVVEAPVKVKGPPMPVIEDFSAINYPPEFLAPKAPVAGVIRYETAFLLQFQQLCKETDEDLSELKSLTDNPGNNPNDKRGNSRRSGSNRGSRSGGEFSRSNSRDNRSSDMGNFKGGRQISHRQGSSNGPNMERQGSKSRSGRGGKNGNRGPKGQVGAPTIPLDQVVPLEKSENRWVPTVVATEGAAPAEPEAESDLIAQDVIIRKVKSLLNKLTLEKFDSISDQIWEYCKQSEKEEDAQSLKTVIGLVFDKAIDEPNFAAMWARLSRKMCVLMSEVEIADVGILDKEQKPVSGQLLYRRLLFNRCQQEFQKGWKSNLPKLEENASGDVMMTDEYYAAVKAKRQGLGLVQFIGELFKLQMLTDRIMVDCMLQLCADPSHPEDEEVETLCKLLTTIGKAFESGGKKNKEFFDVYFDKVNEMYKSDTISSRVKFMILDVFDLRKNKWVSTRNQPIGPTTIAQIHEQAKKANEEKEKETTKRSSSSRGGNPMSRQSSRSGHTISRQNSSNNNNNNNNNSHKQENVNPALAISADGWNTVGSAPTSPVVKSGRTNDLANFGKTRSKTRNSVLGPSSSPFNLSIAKAADKKAVTDSRPATPVSTMSNMFSALGGDEDDAEVKKTEAPVVDEPEQIEEAVKEEPKLLSDEVIERRCKNTIEEYFSLRDNKELCECIKELDHTHYRVIFARKLLDVVEKKDEDVQIVCNMIDELYKENLMSREEYVEAFKQFWEIYEDLAIDVPKAPEYVDKLLKAAGIERSEVECEPTY